MKKLLYVLPLGLCLSGCPMGDFIAPPSATGSAAPSQPMNVAGFLNRLESARGSALSVAEKAAVGGAVMQTRSLLDSGQQRFISSVSQVSGLDPATLGILFPPATQPVSQLEVVSKLESKVGHPLGSAEAQLAKAATALRNNSLASLKSNLVGKVANQVGMDAAFVESLMPLLGF